MTDATHLREDFEAWWQEQGQFCRAGGGDYEKTFAYRAYEAATERAAKAVEEEGGYAISAGNLGAQLAAERIAAAIRNGGAG